MFGTEYIEPSDGLCWIGDAFGIDDFTACQAVGIVQFLENRRDQQPWPYN